MSSISDQTLDNANFLTQSIYQQQAHRHVTTSISTNSELIEAVTSGALSATQVHLLTAETQTAGRGQGTRSWQSPKGNVYLSLYYPREPSQHLQNSQLRLSQPISGLLSLCVGYYLAQLPIIQKINNERCANNQINNQANNQAKIGVKWANDIGFYDAGNNQTQHTHPQDKNHGNTIQFSKLSGILIEPVIDSGKMLGLVVGVGLNVQTAPMLTSQTQEGMSYQSVSLADLSSEAKKLSVESLYQPISKAIFQAILTHQRIAGDEVALQLFLADFAMADILNGRQLQVRQDTQIITGQAVGIDKFGCLQLQQETGELVRLFTGKIDVLG